MNQTDKILSASFALISLLALYFTWSNNVEFLSMPDNGGVMGFIHGGLANPAAASLSWDLTFLCLAVVIFMVQDAKRLGVKYVWAYIFFAMTIAIPKAFEIQVLICCNKALFYSAGIL